jgi:phospholipid/cholesterol/gamma-HCH transport system substrate-binding protein
MKNNILETIIGTLVIIVAGYFLYFALHNQEHGKKGGYELIAKFSNVDGMAPGSAIRISGVKVGAVSKITLDPKTYQAIAHLEIEPEYHIPSDTMASINSPGLLGDKYMSLEPGSADDMLKPGDEVTNTQSSASLEKLLGQVIFNLQNLGKNNTSSATPAASASQASPANAAAHP